MSSFSCPIFSNADIFRILNDSGFTIKQEDLINPTSDFVCTLYIDILCHLDPIWGDVDLGQVSFGALGLLENPDAHKVAITKIQIFHKMKEFVGAIDGGNFDLRDVLWPEPRRTAEILSSIINFMLYMEEKVKLLQHIVERLPSTEEKRTEMEERINETNRKILEHEASCEMEQPIVQELDAEVKSLKQTIHNFNKEQMSIKARGLELKERIDSINEKLSQANYELMKNSQENSKLSSKIVQSPDKLQRVLAEKKANRTEVMGAERSAMLSAKERDTKLEACSKALEKMSRHFKEVETLLEQVNSTKTLDKDIKALKAELSDGGLSNKSREAKISEAQGKAKQALELVKAVEKERDFKVTEHTKKLNIVRSETEKNSQSLEQRRLKAEEIVAKGEKLNAEINFVKEQGTFEMRQLIEKGEEIFDEYRKYGEKMTSVLEGVTS